MQHFRENSRIIMVISIIILLAGLYTWSVLSKNMKLEALSSPAAQALLTTGDQTSYTDLEGNEVSFGSHVGEILIVNSWASWSPASASELPMLARVVDEFANEDIHLIAINRKESKTTAERFLKYLNLSNKVELVLDIDDRYFTSVSGYAMPETIFYDRSGNILHHQRGSLHEDDVRQYIQAALDKVE